MLHPRALLLLALVACDGGSSDAERPSLSWTPLTRGFEPTIEESTRPGGGFTLIGAPESYGYWVRQPYARNDWTEVGGGIWRASRGLGQSEEDGMVTPRLQGGGVEWNNLPEQFWGGGFLNLDQGGDLDRLVEVIANEAQRPAFCCTGEELFLVLEDGSPPEQVDLTTFVSLGQREGNDWMVSIGNVRASGVPVLPGAGQTVRCEVPPRSRLLFATAAPGTRLEGSSTFRIRAGDAILFEHEQQLTTEPLVIRHSLQLDASPDVELRFEVEGPPVAGAFLNPILCPIEVGSHGDRPWEPEHPDIVLFLADTFRADNLAAGGGDPAITPTLNRLADRSVVFVEARAPSTWTYPSHASLFAGLYPYQASAADRRTRLPEQAHTLAEHLKQAGYRTVAVTERGYCSRTYGLAQGFEYFEEQREGLELTLARTRDALSADDGRPLFLFVHSYRAHHPYEVSESVRERLGIEGDFFELTERMGRRELPDRSTGSDLQEALGIVLAFEALYRGASADLDLGFAELQDMLEGHGLLPDGFLVFTSDHGEAFCEHGVIRHGDGVWDEVIRVPLFVHGPGLEPREVAWPANLVDLPSTVSRLAGLPPHDGWIGEDLLELDRDRPLFAFQCARSGHSDVAWMRNERKLILRGTARSPQEHEPVLAYDLGDDPAEATSRWGQEDWPAEMRAELERLGEWSFEQLLNSEKSSTGRSLNQQLEALGYGGEDSED